eukprot:1157738-Pelagomonas_calceolata.AAC.5
MSTLDLVWVNGHGICVKPQEPFEDQDLVVWMACQSKVCSVYSHDHQLCIKFGGSDCSSACKHHSNSTPV